MVDLINYYKHKDDIVNYLRKAGKVNSQMLESIFQFLFKFRGQFSTKLIQAGFEAAPSYGKFLKIIKETQECTAQEIAIYLSRDKGQINRALKEMYSKKYIAKKLNPNDKRSQILYLTDSGEEMLQLVAKIEKEMIQQISQDVSKSEMDVLLNVISKFNANL